MHQINIQYFKTPYGELILGSFRDKLCLADWRYRKTRKTIDARIQKELSGEYVEEETDITKQTKLQLNEYFKGKRKEFTIPLLFAGTDFQKKVWNALLKIPYGKTESYSGLSKISGNEKAVRAVASANGANAISIIVPCHRVIGCKGDLVGYAGGLQTKKKLLNLEGYRKDGQIELF
ncbi:MAG: cysteine methyltransferase [Bacteroidetes bacterium]|nr:MAG: cysteine methyltransferase [Bacteroidota bacterium]